MPEYKEVYIFNNYIWIFIYLTFPKIMNMYIKIVVYAYYYELATYYVNISIDKRYKIHYCKIKMISCIWLKKYMK